MRALLPPTKELQNFQNGCLEGTFLKLEKSRLGVTRIGSVSLACSAIGLLTRFVAWTGQGGHNDVTSILEALEPFVAWATDYESPDACIGWPLHL